MGQSKWLIAKINKIEFGVTSFNGWKRRIAEDRRIGMAIVYLSFDFSSQCTLHVAQTFFFVRSLALM